MKIWGLRIRVQMTWLRFHGRLSGWELETRLTLSVCLPSLLPPTSFLWAAFLSLFLPVSFYHRTFHSKQMGSDSHIHSKALGMWCNSSGISTSFRGPWGQGDAEPYGRAWLTSGIPDTMATTWGKVEGRKLGRERVEGRSGKITWVLIS